MLSPHATLADGGATLARLKAGVQAERAALQTKFRETADGAMVLREHRRLVDRVLKEMWRQLRLPAPLALLAVGGYGRGELYPHSDVDVLVLLQDPASAGLAGQIEKLVGRLWDTGLELAHSVRTVAECVEEARKDVTVMTSLLEARQVAGNRGLFARFDRARRNCLDPEVFFKAKRLEQEQRHTKFQDSPYSLEPNLKEAPGGLRDLQVILWISQACGLGNSWAELAQRALITREEARQVQRHHRFLQNLRVRLHYAAGRREDRLLFDYQDSLARELGYSPTAHRRAGEQLMQSYFRTAKAVTQLNTILLQNMGAEIFPARNSDGAKISEKFRRVGELLEAHPADLFEREPTAILESFLVMQQHSELKGMTAQTLRALWRARTRIDAAFRRDLRNRAIFLSLLQQPRGIVHELRRMNQYGILGRYLPAFRRIVGQMQHDLFHAYTVDQHILTVVRNVRRFTMLEFAHEYPLCSRLIASLERHWLLYIAAIFHDIAKGRGGDHSQLGRIEARRFCREHGLAAEDTQLVEFLVQHHLTMSSVAQKQDLSDPEVLRRFADVVGTERQLVALYLLTVADIRGTSPKVWNAWKGKLLEDLFRATQHLLKGGKLEADQYIQGKQEEAKRLLRLYGLSDTVQDALWRHFDVPYFLRHDAQEIAWHARLLHHRESADKPVVKARLSPAGEGLQVMIYVPDQRELFARISGYFGSIGFSIVDAKIYTTRHGYALDTFQVMDIGSVPHPRDMIAQIESELADWLANQVPLPQPVQGRVSRRVKHFPIAPEVRIVPDEKGQYHSLSITAGDRPGLLYAIALVLSRYGVSLHTAKIATLGERAEDVFVVSGAALANPKTVLQLETDLLKALQA
ncbi:MAG: [protein-PII] uridylyltransferase [Betaproteobacteria bacterium]|nr:MAG: [protein-PII] uridylyltransferase [Betaproteobacteria bacterium]